MGDRSFRAHGSRAHGSSKLAGPISAVQVSGAPAIEQDHPVLDALIARYRAKRWHSFRLDSEQLLVLHFWEIAALAATEAEALKTADLLHSLAIDQHLAFTPEPAPWWNLAARSRNRRLKHQVERMLSAAAHASRWYSFQVRHGPQISTAQTNETAEGTP